MAVTVLARSDAMQDGLQTFDPRRHLGEVADLVGRVFADELDAQGRSAVREMRAVGRLSPIMGGLMQFAMWEDMIAGYVWLANGNVVGNVTLQPVDHGGMRWRISNVAVAPEYRGRGIARALMLASLREIMQRGGVWGILQVRADNPVARHLYDELGFSVVCADGIWRLTSVSTGLPPVTEQASLQPLKAGAWHTRYELAKAAQTPFEAWAQPVNAEQFRTSTISQLGESVGRATGLWRVARWGAWQHDELLGALETRAGATSPFTLRFIVRPEARGTLEPALVARGLHDLALAGNAPVVVEHSADHVEGIAALEAAGFQVQRVLVTMRRRMTSTDRGL